MLTSCAGVETTAGRVQVRRQSESAATPMGQLAYFIASVVGFAQLFQVEQPPADRGQILKSIFPTGAGIALDHRIQPGVQVGSALRDELQTGQQLLPVRAQMLAALPVVGNFP